MCGGEVADADMALWVLHAKYFQDTDNNPEIKKYYETDSFLIQLRTTNIMEPLKSLKLSTLAEGLTHIREELSAVTACYLVEVAVRDYAKKVGAAWTDKFELYKVIEDLKVKKFLPSDLIGRMHRARIIRNAFFHEDKKPTHSQSQEVIKTIKEIESRLSQYPV